MNRAPSQATAVVIGAGVSGLAATAALAGRLAHVTLIDRDVLPDTAVPRRGVPQSGQAHLLLRGGLDALEQLLPGFFADLVANGGLPMNAGRNVPTFQFGALRIPFDSAIELVSVTRPMIEHTLRARVGRLPNVTIRQETAATGLRDDGSGRVRGVRVDSSGRSDEIEADLVVDAMGRGGNQANHWLSAIGYPVPEVETVKVSVAYATREYRREPGDDLGASMVFTLEEPPQGLRAGVIFPVEQDRFVVTLAGWHNDHPTTDDEGYAAFAESLPAPTISQAVRRLQPISEIRLHQFPASRWRHFERLGRVPAGYVALGDALCSFNPLYAQGMTAGAMQAEALGRLVDRHGVGDRLPAAFYREASKVISAPWLLATGSDFVYPQTVGKRPFGINVLNRYVRKVVRASHVRPDIHELMIRVSHLVEPLPALLRPATVMKVLRAAGRSPAPNRPAP